MEKKTAGLLGVLAGLATMGSAHAAVHPGLNPAEALQASSYADLLAPIPNAVALLKTDNEAQVQKPASNSLHDAQFVQNDHHQQYRQQSEHHHYQPYQQPAQHHHHYEQYRHQPQHHHHYQQYRHQPRHHHHYRQPLQHHHHYQQ